MPTRKPSATAAAMPPSTPTTNGMLRCMVISADAYAPTAKYAACPSEICPV